MSASARARPSASPRAPGEPSLRAARAADLPAIAAIDRACFGNPWTHDVYEQELFRPFARLVLLEHEGAIAGLSCTWILGDEAHLLRIATDPVLRRRGLGARLLDAVLRTALEEGAARVLLEVAAGNVAAVSLYRGVGFHEIGRRKGYYAHPPDDALVMQCSLR